MSKPPTDNDLSLTVTISGRPYPLRVSREDEPAIRSISKEINEKLNGFHKQFVGKDRQDCLAMLLMIYAVDLYKLKDGRDAGAAPATGALSEEALATIDALKSEIRTALAESAVDEEDENGDMAAD